MNQKLFFGISTSKIIEDAGEIHRHTEKLMKFGSIK